MYTCQGDTDVRDERRRLTRDDVLAEAIDLIDQQGLDALTMRNLADRLGVVPMALYRHVRNKDDLMEGVLDRAVASVDLPDPGLGWRDGLAALADSIRTTMLRHPADRGPGHRPAVAGPCLARGGRVRPGRHA